MIAGVTTPGASHRETTAEAHLLYARQCIGSLVLGAENSADGVVLAQHGSRYGERHPNTARHPPHGPLSLTALGVIYGYIGTSP